MQYQSQVEELKHEILEVKKENLKLMQENTALKTEMRKMHNRVTHREKLIDTLIDPQKTNLYRKEISEHGASMVIKLTEENDKLNEKLTQSEHVIRKLQQELNASKAYFPSKSKTSINKKNSQHKSNDYFRRHTRIPTPTKRVTSLDRKKSASQIYFKNPRSKSAVETYQLTKYSLNDNIECVNQWSYKTSDVESDQSESRQTKTPSTNQWPTRNSDIGTEFSDVEVEAADKTESILETFDNDENCSKHSSITEVEEHNSSSVKLLITNIQSSDKVSAETVEEKEIIKKISNNHCDETMKPKIKVNPGPAEKKNHKHHNETDPQQEIKRIENYVKSIVNEVKTIKNSITTLHKEQTRTSTAMKQRESYILTLAAEIARSSRKDQDFPVPKNDTIYNTIQMETQRLSRSRKQSGVEGKKPSRRQFKVISAPSNECDINILTKDGRIKCSEKEMEKQLDLIINNLKS